MAKENNRSSYFGDVVKKFLAHRLAMMGTIVLLIDPGSTGSCLPSIDHEVRSLFHGLHGIWRCSFS